MTAYDRWLEQPIQEHEAKMEAIQEIAEDLMEDEFDPHRISVFMQAISDGVLEDSEDQIAEAIKQGRSGFEALGKAVWQAVYDHCQSQADAMAITFYNNRNHSKGE